MEQFPSRYSKEKAEDEAARMQTFLKNKQAKTYEGAEVLAELSASEKRPDGKYQEDFGHRLEFVVQEVLREVPGVVEVSRSSEHDDKLAHGHKVDIIVYFEDGAKIALQVTASGIEELGSVSTTKYEKHKPKGRSKYEELLRNPLLHELHDDKGNVIAREDIPRGLAVVKKEEWGAIFNTAKERHVPFTRALPTPSRLDFLERLMLSLQAGEMALAKRDKTRATLYQKPIQIFQKSIQELQSPQGHA